MQRSVGLRILLSAALAAGTAGLLELAAGYGNQRWQLDLCLEGEMEFDRELFWRLPRQGWRDRVPVQIGPMHLREHQHPSVPHGRPERRVLALGDSSIFGWGVGAQDGFAHQLELQLAQSCPSWHWVVINGGVPGYSSHQSLGLLERLSEQVDPDLLIVGNLFDDAMHWRWTDRQLEERLASPLALASMGMRALTRSTQLGRAGTCQLRVHGPERFRRRESIPWETLRLYAEEPIEGPVRVSLEDYRANIDAMLDHIEARGGRAVGLLLARESEVRGLDRDPLMDQYRQAMTGIMAARGYPAVDLAPAFSAALAEHDTLWLDEIHPDSTGHAIIARELASAIAATPSCAAEAGP